MEKVKFTTINEILDYTYTYFYDRYLSYIEYNVTTNFLPSEKNEYPLNILTRTKDDIQDFLEDCLGFKNQNSGNERYIAEEMCGILDDKILDKIIDKRASAFVDAVNYVTGKYKLYSYEEYVCRNMTYYLEDCILKATIYKKQSGSDGVKKEKINLFRRLFCYRAMKNKKVS